MTSLQAMLALAVLMVVAMSAGWLWQRVHHNAGVVDVLWTSGLGLAALLMAISGDGAMLPRALTGVMGGLWALRLAVHLGRRVGGEGEDGRYRYLRTHWHGHQGKFFLFFQGQAVIVLLFALPFMAAAANPSSFSYWMVVAIIIWAISLLGESIADRQLARHRADLGRRGTTFREGLWRYSRHPNYLFEWLHWFAYVALAVASPIWWLAWVGPIVMYAFLRWVSGIPFTEDQALRSRGEDYRDYQRTTSMLIPWVPAPSSRHGKAHDHHHR